MASTSDKITDTRNSARPNSARVSSARSSGGATLVCDNLAGWPTASKVHFVTYQIDSNSNPVAGTQLDCSGIVSGNNIGSLTVVDGTDNGNAINDVVEMLPTAKWGQDLADALTAEHSRTGTHTAITATSITDSGALTVSGTATHSGATVLTGAVSGAGYSVGTISNPYKFRAYRNAAANTGSAAFAVIACDTEVYDTNNNLSSGVYTAPITGYYWISGGISCVTGGSNTDLAIGIFKNGSEYARGTQLTALATTNSSLTVGSLVPLTAGDTADLRAYGSAAQALNVGLSYQNYFSGFLVSAT